MRRVMAILSCLWVIGCGDKPAPAREVVRSEPVEKPAPKRTPLRIGYSDWPGYVAWEVALQQGWFREAGVEVELVWFEYAPSLEAFGAGKLDAVGVTNGDMLTIGSSGARSVAILITDYSDGNDMVVARRGIDTMKQLRGKKIGVELGFVDHLLLLHALKSANMKPEDVTMVNVPTDQTPQLLRSGDVDAIVAWQPSSGQALEEAPGSKAIFTSADVPGLLYDVVAVDPKSLAERRDDWKRVLRVWSRIIDTLKDPTSPQYERAATWMAKRSGLTLDKYKPMMRGLRLFDLPANLEHFKEGDTLQSVYHSTRVADDFQVANGVYKEPASYKDYFDETLINEVTRETLAAAPPSQPSQ
jgi:NitT/TauT family transport system substrate-binding protein